MMGVVTEADRQAERVLLNWNPDEAKSLASWFDANFILKPARVPSDMKLALWQLNAFVSSLRWANESLAREHWIRTKEVLPAIAAKFSTEVRGDLIREITVNGVRYQNLQSLPKLSFMKMVNTIDNVFKSIKGWRRKGLRGTPNVAFAGADLFRGTTKARYNAKLDTMFVRATPAVVKRTGGEYASFEYILVHELGHRYEHNFRPYVNFTTHDWWTTPYSRHEGVFGQTEAFAEMFALGHFGITSHGHLQFEDVLQRFESINGSEQTDSASRVASQFLSQGRPMTLPTERILPGTRLYHGTRAMFSGLPRLPAMFGTDRREVEYYTKDSWHAGPAPRVIEAQVLPQAGDWVVAKRWSEVASALGVSTTEAAINNALLTGGYAGWIMRGGGEIGAVTVVDPAAIRFVQDIPITD